MRDSLVVTQQDRESHGGLTGESEDVSEIRNYRWERGFDQCF